MPEPKVAKTVIQAFYKGGTKLKAGLLVDRKTVEDEIKNAKLNNRSASFETADEDRSVTDSWLYLNVGPDLMFYNIHTPVEVKVLTS